MKAAPQTERTVCPKGEPIWLCRRTDKHRHCKRCGGLVVRGISGQRCTERRCRWAR